MGLQRVNMTGRLNNNTVYTYFFSHSCPFLGIQFTVLLRDIECSSLCYSLLVTYFIYSSVHMLIPNPSSIPSPAFPFGNHKFVFYVCESISVLYISHFYHFFLKIPHISNIIYLPLHIYFSLTVYLRKLHIRVLCNKAKQENSLVLSCVQLFVTTWTIARQALLCMEFSKQEYWNG